MLKIKDNVDLKELEKFGFEYKKEDEQYILDTCKKEYGFSGFVVCEGSNYIYNYSSCNNDVLDILYDLIKADLVEKCGDE